MPAGRHVGGVMAARAASCLRTVWPGRRRARGRRDAAYARRLAHLDEIKGAGPKHSPLGLCLLLNYHARNWRQQGSSELLITSVRVHSRAADIVHVVLLPLFGHPCQATDASAVNTAPQQRSQLCKRVLRLHARARAVRGAGGKARGRVCRAGVPRAPHTWMHAHSQRCPPPAPIRRGIIIRRGTTRYRRRTSTAFATCMAACPFPRTVPAGLCRLVACTPPASLLPPVQPLLLAPPPGCQGGGGKEGEPPAVSHPLGKSQSGDGSRDGKPLPDRVRLWGPAGRRPSQYR